MTATKRIVTVGLAAVAVFAGLERRPFDAGTGSLLPAPFATLAAQSTAPVAEFVANIRPDTTAVGSSLPGDMAVFNNVLYFAANDGVTGRELWRLGPTGAPTLVDDLLPGAASSAPHQLTVAGDRLYFVATSATNGEELWQYDGVSLPSVAADIWLGTQSSDILYLTALGTEVVFRANDGTGDELFAFGPEIGLTPFDIWQNDPSCDPGGGGCGSYPYGLTVYQGILYFGASDEVFGTELHRYDGTVVTRLTDIMGGLSPSDPQFMTGIGNQLVFSAFAGFAKELYAYDLTTIGSTPTLLTTGVTSGFFGVQPTIFTSFNGRAYFSVDDDSLGRELWTTDGTQAGTRLVQDINPGAASSNPRTYAAFNGELYFSAVEATVGQELWATNGDSVRLVTDLNPGPADMRYDNPTPFGAFLVFSLDLPIPSHPWVTTGTAAGTNVVRQADGTLINPAGNSVDDADFVAFNGALYFPANDGVRGVELWRITLGPTSPTTTTLVSSLNPSNAGDQVTFTATVTGAGATPTGTVTFLNSGTPLGTETLVNGIATLNTNSLNAGSHTITASYSGDAANAPSTSSGLSQIVTAVQTSTALTASPNPADFTQLVTFTATVAGGTPTGSVSFFNGGNVLATVMLGANGIASVTTGLSIGTYVITAEYGGDLNHASSTSNPVSQEVTRIQTTLTLTASPTPSRFGDLVTFSVVVSGSAPAGTVVFTDGATTLGSIGIAGNNGAFATDALSVGSHTITATYEGSASHAGSTDSLIHVVNAPNVPPTAPVADPQNVTTAEDTAVGITLSGSDANGDTLTFIDITSPMHGTLTGTPPSVTYTPSLNYNGFDSFSFKVNDGTFDSAPAVVIITVSPVNDAPVAADDAYGTLEDIPLIVAAPGVLGNDSDVDLEPLTAVLVTPPARGVLSLNANGSFTYTPAAHSFGADSFTYRASDGLATSTLATVSITVTSVNDPPIAVNDTYTTTEGTTLAMSAPGVLANDTDIEASPLTAALASGPANGTLTLNPNGSFTYTPTGVFAGLDSFTYLASDGMSPSNTATVTINVVPRAFTWTATGNLSTRRRQHSATLLLDGKVLVAGGRGQGNAVESSAEIYDPVTGLWMATGSMRAKRAYHTATRLPNGHVLVVGGESNVLLNSAEIYDPETASWTAAGTLLAFHSRHSATLLPDGRVLVAGGYDNSGPYAGAEIYDPLTRTWSATGSMLLGRNLHAAILLPTGKVLVAAGYSTDAGATNRAEVYDPASGIWSEVASLATRRATHATTLLANGKVLVTGGGNNTDAAVTTAEIYDPATDTWTAAGSMSTPRVWHSAILLPSGRVLVAGGSTSDNALLTSADVFDPVTGQWSATASHLAARRTYTLTLLNDGRVLAAGGGSGNGSLGSAELYGPISAPSLGRWDATGGLAVPRTGHTATLLADGRVLVAGGQQGQLGMVVGSTEIFDPSTGAWTPTGSLNVARAFHVAVLLPDGKLLVAGGLGGGAVVLTAEIYDPETGTWTDTGSPNLARSAATATLLPGDRGVLLAGGIAANGGYASSAEIFNLTTKTWSSAGSFSGGRYGHRATLLSDGRVLLTGGFTSGGNPYLSSAVIYDPATFTWSNVANMASRRASHSATLLRDGRVLVAGGGNRFGSLDTAEIFDPVSGTWTQTGFMKTSRVVHSATLLPNGRILVAGGTQTGNIVLPTSELYDPVAGTWTTTRSLTMSRSSHTATLLTNGTVLAVGGNTLNGVVVATAEIYTP